MTDTRALRAAVYVRISRDRIGAGLGVQRQESDCRDLAKRLHARVVVTYVDNDLSAYSGKPRPGYRALLDQVRRGELDVVLVWHTDRLHRSPIELEEWIDAAQPHAVDVHTCKAGPIDLSTPSGRMVARQLGAVARYESEHRAERVAAQKAQAAAAGLWRGGRRPYGYEADGVTVRPAEAAVVVEATTRVLAGESLHSVARDLNERGIPTSTGRTWKPPELRGVLLRARNAGLIEHDGHEIAAAQWPAIVDPAAWRNLRRLVTDPARRPARAADVRWLGSGLYLCGVCDDGCTTMKSATVHKRSGRSIPSYFCRNANHLTRVAEPLDDFVTKLVIERLSRDDARLLLAPRGGQVDVEALYARRADLSAQLAEIGRDAVRMGIPLATVAAMAAGVETQLAEIDAQVSASTSHSALAGFADADDVAEAWKNASISRRKAIVNDLMTVTITKAPRGRPKGWTPGESYFDPETVTIEWRRPPRK